MQKSEPVICGKKLAIDEYGIMRHAQVSQKMLKKKPQLLSSRKKVVGSK